MCVCSSVAGGMVQGQVWSWPAAVLAGLCLHQPAALLHMLHSAAGTHGVLMTNCFGTLLTFVTGWH